jgi:CDP-6-deoxy-D-xylo-4-hexulose-3-dehydrase
MAALKLKYPEGGQVIVPPLTWVSDIASVLQNGFDPIFVDIDPRTLGMETEAILDAITPSTRAVFLSHIQGFNGLTDRLLEELERRDIPLIEDVCESHGATHKGKRVGSFGWTSNFSFYYAHHMSTIEGGMICTDDEETYRVLRMLRSHGMVREIGDEEEQQKWLSDNPELNPQFIFAFPAYNVRNTEIGAVLGLSQLQRLDANNALRTRNLLHFLDNIDSKKFQTDFEIEGSSNYAFNLVQLEADDALAKRLMSAMDRHEIEYRRGSAGGGNQLRQPYLRPYIKDPKSYRNFPATDHIHFYGYYIGNFPDLGLEDVDFICDVLNNA